MQVYCDNVFKPDPHQGMNNGNTISHGRAVEIVRAQKKKCLISPEAVYATSQRQGSELGVTAGY